MIKYKNLCLKYNLQPGAGDRRTIDPWKEGVQQGLHRLPEDVLLELCREDSDYKRYVAELPNLTYDLFNVVRWGYPKVLCRSDAPPKLVLAALTGGSDWVTETVAKSKALTSEVLAELLPEILDLQQFSCHYYALMCILDRQDLDWGFFAKHEDTRLRSFVAKYANINSLDSKVLKNLSADLPVVATHLMFNASLPVRWLINLLKREDIEPEQKEKVIAGLQKYIK